MRRASILALLALALAAVAAAAPGARITAHLSKTSFTTAQTRAVTLTYRFSKTSRRFTYAIAIAKASRWQTVKRVARTGSFRGTHRVRLATLFAGKSVRASRYRLTLTADGGSTRIAFRVTKPAHPAPDNTARPSISGSAVEGQTLTASDGTWSNSPPAFSRQWRRCDSSGGGCADIGGATSSSHTLVAADVGSTIRVVVTATNSYGSASATSAPTAVVTARPAARPRAGNWVATSLTGPVSGSSGGGTVKITSLSFAVGGDQASVGGFGFGYDWSGTPAPPTYNCSGSGVSFMTSGATSPIANDAFSSPNPTGAWSGPVSGFVSGSFDSPTTAHGTADASAYIGGTGCAFSSSPKTGTFSWTAAWQAR